MTELTKGRAGELAAGYSRGHRLYELGGIAATGSTTIWLCINLCQSQRLSGWWMPLAALVGILFADFISGFVHWMFDTWGAVDTPVLGALAIRTFRHHHVDQKAMLVHDFVETNGHNITLSLTLSTIGIYFVQPSSASLFDVFIGLTCLTGIVFVSLTSQIHKWAHMGDEAPNVIKLLQRARLILSPDHHEGHHAAPYNHNYCITVGWMNGPLRAIRFFETLEWAITVTTGALPREDDLGKDEAILVAEAQGVEGCSPAHTERALPSRE